MVPGFTLQGTVVYNTNRETANEFLDNNGFQVRPAVLGDMRPRSYNVVYLGASGDGHFGRWNTTGSLYWALGHDDHNQISQNSAEHQRVLRRRRGVARFRLGAHPRQRAVRERRQGSLRRQGKRLRRDPRESAVRRRRHELLDPAGGAADRRRRRHAVRPQRRAAVAALVQGSGPVELHQSGPHPRRDRRRRRHHAALARDRQREPAVVQQHVVAVGAAQPGRHRQESRAPTYRSPSSTARCSSRTSCSTRRRPC